MKNKTAHQTLLAIILLVGFLVPIASAQQAGTTAKPPTESAPPSATSEVGSTPGAAASTQKVVLKVGRAQVTQSEIDFLISNLNPQAQQALATQGRRPLGEEYLKVLLLSQQAENDHLESAPEIRERIALQRTQMLAQAEYDKMLSEVKVGTEEVGQYFAAHQADFETAQVREFVVRKKPEGAKEGTPGLTAEQAKTKSESIRSALVAGADPKKVAKESSVADVVMIDPEPRTVRRGQLLPALDKAAFELKEGAVSDSLDAPQAIVFLQVVGHHHPEQKDVAADIENTLRQQKLDAAVANLRNKTTVWMDEDYFKPQPATMSPATTEPPTTPSKPKP